MSCIFFLSFRVNIKIEKWLMELGFKITAEVNTTRHNVQNGTGWFYSNLVFFSLSGKQDYKKTKSALKATRLKAEAKKNSSGFRVRLSWTYFCFTLPRSVICMSSSISACLVWPICLSVFLPTIFFPFVCLSSCLLESLLHQITFDIQDP